MYYNNLNEHIAAYTSPTSFPSAGEYLIAGFDNPGDGGGGTFVWVAVSSPTQLLPHDNGIIIRTPQGSGAHTLGYSKRIYSGPVNVRWFGAKGDGVTDDTAAVHAAAKAAQYGT